MASRAKPGGKRGGARTGAKSKASTKKARTKKTRPKKPYGRTHHRHTPGARSNSKRVRETTGVDEDLEYGAGTRGHRWSRAPAVYAGGVADRRQSYGRRATDQAPPESFTLQDELQGDQKRR